MSKRKLTKSNIYMITGIVVLIITIAGSAYAYYSASATGEIVGSAAGAGLELTVTKLSTSANDALIPLDNDVNTLSTAAKGYGNSTSSFDGSKSCIDRNGYSVCQVYKITISNTSSVPITVNGEVNLYGAYTPNIECSKMESSIVVTDNTSCKSPNNLADNYVLKANTSQDYYIMVYINNINEPQDDNGRFNGEIIFTSTQGSSLKARFGDELSLTDYIINLYNSSSKTVVTNNDIEYNQAPEVSLMNDRLGGTTSSLDGGNIRYYGESPNNYIDIGDVYKRDTIINNLDKFGLSDYMESSECYESLDCSKYEELGYEDETSCREEILSDLKDSYGVSSIDELCGTTTMLKGSPILYRIIGVFKDIKLPNGTKQNLVKIVRDEPIGKYSYDTSDDSINSGYGINEWSQADAMKLMNPGYDDNKDLDTSGNTIIVNNSLWWNSKSGTCYANGVAATNCDFMGNGLSDNAKNKIATVIWNTGGYDDDYVYSNQAYTYERGTNVVIPGTTCSGVNCNDTVVRTSTWTGKIGLMYPSDCGYATDFSKCSETINQYSSEASCRSSSWIVHGLYNAGYEFLLTPYSAHPLLVFLGGYSSASINGDFLVTHSAYLRPTLYLTSDVVINTGDGSIDNPFVIE